VPEAARARRINRCLAGGSAERSGDVLAIIGVDAESPPRDLRGVIQAHAAAGDDSMVAAVLSGGGGGSLQRVHCVAVLGVRAQWSLVDGIHHDINDETSRNVAGYATASVMIVKYLTSSTAPTGLGKRAAPSEATALVSPFLAWIGSPCLRQRVHGESIGAFNRGRRQCQLGRRSGWSSPAGAVAAASFVCDRFD
jgi:hypothetical protein